MDLSRFAVPDFSAFDVMTAAPDALIAALVSAVATLVLMRLARRRTTGARPAAPRPGAASISCDFLISGTSLKAMTEPARALLDGLAPAPSRLAALSAHLAPDCPGVEKDLEALVLHGTPFRHHCARRDGSALDVLGEPRGAVAFLSIRPASEDARALRDAQTALARAGDEARFLRDVLDRAPLMAWSLAPDGQVSWASAAYRERFDPPASDLPDHRIADAFAHVIEEVPLTGRAGTSRRRVSIPGRTGTDMRWFEITQTPEPGGETLGFALEADDLVAAEASLRRFVETLTETFAHLPIGLAVFDKNRRLGLFNPALTDLVKIDAVWLAGRPSLRDFLERLRETRQMPEQKDFAAWRRKLGEIEEGAREGAFEENWLLPSGKVFRVTGRPHPQGALAFLFEDISSSIILERKYRSELELSQATLDRMSEAVAVFDTSGMLVFVNSAFESLWGFDPMARLDGPGVAEMTQIWAERCAPSASWGRVREFATADEARASWTAAIEILDGRRLQLHVAPLPDASALIVFRDLSAERADLAAAKDRLLARTAARELDAALDDLALEQLHPPVEAAMRQLMAAIPAARDPGAFQALSAAAQGLKDGLVRARALRDLARGGAWPEQGGPLPGLVAAFAARGLTLAAPAEAATWDADLRRAALALGLAAADLAAPAAVVALSVDPGREGRRLTAVTEAAAQTGRSEAVSLGLARRVVEAAGGALRLEQREAGIALVADLPAGPATAALPPPERARRA